MIGETVFEIWSALGLVEIFGFHLFVSRAAVLIGCSSGESTYPPNRQIIIANIDIAIMAV